MRLSLRFIIPLLLALGVVAWAVRPLVDRLTLTWFVRDLDLRATLIANTVQEPVQELVLGNFRTRVLQLFTRITQDERLYAGYKSIAANPEFSKLTQAQKKIIENIFCEFGVQGRNLLLQLLEARLFLRRQFRAGETKIAQGVLDDLFLRLGQL